MAVRNFAGDNSELRVPIVAASDTTGAVTVAALVKRNTTGTWQSMIAHHNSSGGYLSEFGFAGSGTTDAVVWGDPTTAVTRNSSTVVTSTTTWHILAYTRPAGAATGRFHIFPLGGAWTHEVGVGANVNNMPSQSGGSLRFGEAQDVDDLNARLAVVGLWKAELTDAQVEALATNLRTADWTGHAVAPVGVWQMNQANAADAVPDLKANHVDISGSITSTTDTNGIAGTTIVTTDDPPGWTFQSSAPSFSAPSSSTGGGDVVQAHQRIAIATYTG